MSGKTFPIPFRPLVQRCDSFVNKDGDIETATIIVVPTKIALYDEVWTVTWRCNRGLFCKNEYCAYSQSNKWKGEPKK